MSQKNKSDNGLMSMRLTFTLSPRSVVLTQCWNSLLEIQLWLQLGGNKLKRLWFCHIGGSIVLQQNFIFIFIPTNRLWPLPRYTGVIKLVPAPSSMSCIPGLWPSDIQTHLYNPTAPFACVLHPPPSKVSCWRVLPLNPLLAHPCLVECAPCVVWGGIPPVSRTYEYSKSFNFIVLFEYNFPSHVETI